VGDGEPIESAVRRWTREVKKSGHLMELRHKRYFENSQEKKKRKIKDGRLRKKFERMANRRMRQNQQPPGVVAATTTSPTTAMAVEPEAVDA
jgi:small subunit ribosomal protein S21